MVFGEIFFLMPREIKFMLLTNTGNVSVEKLSETFKRGETYKNNVGKNKKIYINIKM